MIIEKESGADLFITLLNSFIFTASRIASTVTYPLQVLKARIQQRADSIEITPEGDVRAVRRKYHGVVKSVRRMWKREGFAGFFRGCIPNALRVAPGSAITFLVYESVMDMLR